MNASAIVVAAGSGTRLGLAQPKAFIKIGDESLLLKVLRTIGMVRAVGEVVIAVPPGLQKLARAEAVNARLTIPAKITEGGVERQDSVRKALMLTSAEADLIVVHDAARPFATPAMFSACLDAAARGGAAIVGIPVADTLKLTANETIVTTIARDGLWHAHTPQAFRRELLISAHERAVRDGIAGTDDAQLCELLGAEVKVVTGSSFNMKITTPDDLRIAKLMAAPAKKPHVNELGH
jgi:2-C-methyl-D-erythritol 4-phosphate cytidylyltransferase